MFDPNETWDRELDPPALQCLECTRSAVLNVLVAVGLLVALTGAVLRGRGRELAPGGQERAGSVLLLVLLGIFVASTLLRRWLGRRDHLREPASRCRRFYWGHVLPAVVGALAAPLGLVQGLLISPRLEAILPFWIAALVLGVLAYPRSRELQGFEHPMTPPGAPAR